MQSETDVSKRARRSEYLPFSPPCISEAEVEAVADTLRSGWITTGPKVKQFEREFAEYIGVSSAHAVNSCTGALHIGLVALGIGPGDEVITTPMTFAASVNVIEHVGALPVLVDIEADTLLLDPQEAAKAITPRTKAILPVHYAGHPVDMAPLVDLADQHDLRLLEDAAHSLPATYDGQNIGTIGDLTAFSFYATKKPHHRRGGHDDRRTRVC
jgi:dTDP-4-amino-4,6-dideoxygalactose transaminase